MTLPEKDRILASHASHFGSCLLFLEAELVALLAIMAGFLLRCLKNEIYAQHSPQFLRLSALLVPFVSSCER